MKNPFNFITNETIIPMRGGSEQFNKTKEDMIDAILYAFKASEPGEIISEKNVKDWRKKVRIVNIDVRNMNAIDAEFRVVEDPLKAIEYKKENENE